METLKILLIIWTILYLAAIPGMWATFKKLNIDPWYSPWPLINSVVLMEYYKIPVWLIILFILPFFSLPILALVNYKLAKSFGLNIGFAIGLTLWFTKPVFFSLLGFGKYEFIGKEGLV